ncbi:unnamed protein product, partial [marine sediment metagenome]
MLFKKLLLAIFGVFIATNIWASPINDFIRGDDSDVVEGG